jgi:crotonobetainyl-CoA:carnitine CoA-transferase CaiB-like acyl-CoA transferase
MGALYHREKTGEATTVDVSLLSTGIWSMGAALALSLQHGVAWAPPASKSGSPSGNPLVGNYKTKDDRFVALCCLQPGKYWAEAVQVVGLPELADDPRFADAPTILQNGQEGYALLAEKFAEKTLEEWREALADFSGQWAVVQNTLEAAVDPQSVANGYISELETADGVAFKLANSPVQFGGEPAQAKRAPEFNEHGDAILESIGLDMETILDLKVKGVVA